MAISATERIVAPAPRTRLAMRGRYRLLLIALGIVVAGAAIVVTLRASRWAQEIDASRAALTSAVPASLPPVSLSGTEDLPAPVRRYLRMALSDGQPRPAMVTMEQAGRLRTGVESEQWLDFTATETTAPDARGFVWDARLRLAPLVHASIRDVYVGGVGDGRVALQSAITVAADHGGHDLNSGELYRLLAEAPHKLTLLVEGRLRHITF